MSSKDENLSLVLHPSKQLTLENRPIPKPKDDELLIAINCTGVCGSDIHLWSWGRMAATTVNTPTVIGHESSGTVVEIGKDVKEFKVGDRVVIETSDPCYKCSRCLEGYYHLCPSIKLLGLPPYHGTYTRYITHSATFCFKIPDHVNFEEGAMVEPLSVAVYACHRGRITAGDKVLICGAGPIGLLTMLSARAVGATEICITDIRQDRLDFARKLGANHVILSDPDTNTCVRQIHEAFEGLPDVTIDCCGIEATLRVAILATKPRGVVTIVGLGRDEMKLPLVNAVWKEIDIVGVNRYPNFFSRAIALLSSGQINVRPLVSHRFKLENAIEALEMVRDEKPGTVKVLIQCEKNS